MTAWAMAIGPVAVWRVVTHGTTTVWDHEVYPGRTLAPSPDSVGWRSEPGDLPESVRLDSTTAPVEDLFMSTKTLSFIVVEDGAISYEWYGPSHSADRPTMLFSVTKSILALLIGAAIDDGLMGPPSLSAIASAPDLTQFSGVTIESLLRMDSNIAYVEDDNPFGTHVEFNYTDDLPGAIAGLRVRNDTDPGFTYKSGDYAVLSVILDESLDGISLTEYLEERLWHPLGAESGGVWSTDREGGLERAWCCLAMTARDLARFGQLVLEEGSFNGRRLVSAQWIDAMLSPGFEAERWPADMGALANYGYGWWMTESGAWVALGKDGQYLYVDRDRRLVVVRLGEASGDVSWIEVIEQLTARDEP
jgi:CubicO group peptidase (beta-lactamase class C family)